MLRLVLTIGTPSTVSAVQGVADELRSAIHRGDITPGDRLPPERELAASLGVSRITLREAIRILADEGYLAAKRGQQGGTFVTALEEPYQRWLQHMRGDFGQLEDIIEFRIAVERRAAKLAAKRRTDMDLATLEEAMDDMALVTDRASYRRADNFFHGCVADASRSPRLIEAIAAARGELFMHTDQIVYDELVAETQAQHRRILDGIRSGDDEATANAVEAHIESTRLGLHAMLFADS
jgi:GntR family transcriptional repressor for pyruvate dehydrogenase complex